MNNERHPGERWLDNIKAHLKTMTVDIDKDSITFKTKTLLISLAKNWKLQFLTP